MILERVCVGPFQTNCYILGSSFHRKAILIDPGADYKAIKNRLDKKGLKPTFIINTHGHIDHIGADEEFDLPIYIHSQDVDLLKDVELNLSKFFAVSLTVDSDVYTLSDNQDIYLGQIHLKVIHTPGHTPGGICLLLLAPEDKFLFSGDTLFCSGIGRTDIPKGNEFLLIKSIKERLFCLEDDIIVYPGHGPETTIGREKRENLFLK